MKKADFDRWAHHYCKRFALDGAQAAAVATWKEVFERENYPIKELDAATMHLSGPETKARNWPDHLPSIHEAIRILRALDGQRREESRQKKEYSSENMKLFQSEEEIAKHREDLRRKLARSIGKAPSEN